MVRVLLVEDSKRLGTYIKAGLTQAGYAVDVAPDGEEGLWLALSNDYDAVVLDLMLPKMDGLAVLRRMRSEGRKTHVLILTARDTVEERVRGFSEGADDYLVKPFALEELLARVQALVRRSYDVKSSAIRIGDLEIDLAGKTAARQGRRIDLTGREFALLEYLALRKGQVVSRTEIESHLYDEQSELMSNVVDSFVYRLRKKIESPHGPALIHTRRGMGYLIEDPGS
jgi:DNA-binding response OmpR family regulator